ncbi:hypothetical protein NEQG_00260 [Nematocida parisii ERTm3]|uniref:Uncharacterized protein n=1 Tax=Nematocida parisii (strain ERTm3) TaxID=935791 RepID=I3EJU3_NEMP3|nr:hypothetical protein NEQG_00260 [Nematocida parisii ERTm3]
MYLKYGLLLLYIANIKARILWDDVEELQGNSVGLYKDKRIMVSPDGSLDITKAYINNKLGLMHNLRMFNHRLDMKYIIELTTDELDNTKYTYNELSNNSVHHLDINGSVASDISKEYNNCLCNMFLMLDGRVLIQTKEKSSFFTFLNDIPVNKDRLRLLASLFLLSEGIDLSLEINLNGVEKNSVILTKHNNRDEKYFNIDLKMKSNMDHTTETAICLPYDNEYYAVHKSIIEFYIKIKDIIIDKHNNNNTINNARLLIQSYIFEYICSKEDMKNYHIEVFGILTDHIKAVEENQSKNTQEYVMNVFNNIFCPIPMDPTSLKNQNMKMEVIRRVQSIISGHIFIPFHENINIPNIIHHYNNNGLETELCLAGQTPNTHINLNKNESHKDFSHTDVKNNIPIKFIPGTELTILSLLCCCFYNPAEIEYTLETVNKPPEKLKQFFTKYKDLFDINDLSACYDWYNTINALTNDTSKTSFSDYYYNGGLLSMLYTMIDITNGSQSDKNEIIEITKKIKSIGNRRNQNSMSRVKTTSRIIAIIENTMNSLSFNKKVILVKPGLRIDNLKNREPDLFGELILSICNDSLNERTLTIDFTFVGVTVVYDSINRAIMNDNRNILLHISYLYRSDITIANYAKYADKLLLKTDGKYAIQYLTDYFKPLVFNNSIKPHELFSCGRIQCVSDKKALLNCILIQTMSSNCSTLQSNYLLRIATNIIASITKYEKDIIYEFICIIIYSGYGKRFSNNIKIDKQVYSKILSCTDELVGIYGLLIEVFPADIVSKLTRRYIKNGLKNEISNLDIIIYKYNQINPGYLIWYLTNDSSIDNILTIMNAIKIKKGNKIWATHIKYKLWLIWINFAAQNKLLRITKLCFNQLLAFNPRPSDIENEDTGYLNDFNSVMCINSYPFTSYNEIEEVLAWLKMNQSELCPDYSSEEIKSAYTRMIRTYEGIKDIYTNN